TVERFVDRARILQQHDLAAEVRRLELLGVHAGREHDLGLDAARQARRPRLRIRDHRTRVVADHLHQHVVAAPAAAERPPALGVGFWAGSAANVAAASTNERTSVAMRMSISWRVLPYGRGVQLASNGSENTLAAPYRPYAPHVLSWATASGFRGRTRGRRSPTVMHRPTTRAISNLDPLDVPRDCQRTEFSTDFRTKDRPMENIAIQELK